MERKNGWGTMGWWLAGAALVAATGCGGSGGNNDQGIVFRAVGTFRGLESIDQNNITCTEPTTTNVISDASFTLSISSVPNFPNRNFANADPCGGYIGLENSLSRQSINVQEVSITYEVPGSSIPIPPTSVTSGQRILPTTSTEDSSSGQVNLIYVQLVGQIVPSNLMVFLNQNANRLPITPYLMNVFMVARGQSDDGSRYETNEIGYQLTIVP